MLIRPPAPVPRKNTGSLVRLILALRRDPISGWTDRHFSELIVGGNSIFGFGIVVSDPTAIRRVLVTNASNYRKDRYQLQLVSPGMGNGLFTADGPDWELQRPALSPLFSNSEVKIHAEAFCRAASGLVQDLDRHANGSVVDIAPLVSSAAISALNETIFSQSLPHDAATFAAAVNSYLAHSGRLDPLDIIGAPTWIPRLTRVRGNRSLRLLHRAAATMLDNKRNADAQEHVSSPDLMTRLLSVRNKTTGAQLSDEDIKANIITFIAAGHETTANAIIWALFLASLDRSVGEVIQAEVRDLNVSGLHPSEWHQHLRYTRALLDEAMRLYPPAAMISREAIGPDRLSGIHIPAGAIIFMPPYVLHRHKLLWKDPEHFSPWRFLPENRRLIRPFSYLPFGAGQRGCVAMNFAIQEALITIALVLRSYKFAPVGINDILPVQLITLRPQQGVHMTIERIFR